MSKTNENVEKKQREHHVKSLRLLRLEKAIQTIAYPSVPRLLITEGELVALAGILPLLERHDNTPHTLDPYKIYCQKGDWYAVGF